MAAVDSNRPIRFGCTLGLENTTWPQIRDACQIIDDLGFDVIWTFDHLIPADPGHTEGPCLEGWSALSAIAMLTQNAKIGCLVTCNTYRHPVVLAKMATTVDILSEGRLIFGIGAGWAELEHTSYGIPFFTTGQRLDHLEEAVQLIKLLWKSDGPVNFQGKHYNLKGSPFDPKPVQQPHPPILIGGGGEKKTLRIVAKYADAMNIMGSNPETVTRKFDVLEQHCKDLGRDPNEIERTVSVTFVSPGNREEWDRNLKMVDPEDPLAKGGGIVEDLDSMEKYVKQYIGLGADQIVFSLRAPFPLDALRDFSREVIPQFRNSKASPTGS